MNQGINQASNFNKTQSVSFKNPNAKKTKNTQAKKNNIEAQMGTLRNTADRNGGIDTSRSYMNSSLKKTTNKNTQTRKPPTNAKQYQYPSELPSNIDLNAPGKLKTKFYSYRDSSAKTRTINPNQNSSQRVPVYTRKGRMVHVNARDYADSYSYFAYHGMRMGFGVRDDFILEGADDVSGDVVVDPELQNVAHALAAGAAGEYADLKEQYKQGLISKEALESKYKSIMKGIKEKLRSRQEMIAFNNGEKAKTKKARKAALLQAKSNITNEDKAILAGVEYKNIKVVRTDRPQYAG